jgi:signal transduction histidine kinase
MEKIFKPFEKTSVKKTGGEKSTGLGMLISRKIIEAHKGKIWVESPPGRGAAFHFTLPKSGVL